MGFIKKYIEYIKDNPKGLWFKERWYGWGWVPVKWQGWTVVAVGIAIVAMGIYVGDADGAPGAVAIAVLFMIALIFGFGFWKGERPHWNWGDPRKK